MCPNTNLIYVGMHIDTDEFVALSDMMSAKRREMEGEISRLECELEQWKEAAESCRVKVGILTKQPHMLPSEECLVLSCEKLREKLRQIKDLTFSSSFSAILQCCLPHGASPEDCHRVAKLMPMYTIEDKCCETVESHILSETKIPSELTTEEACQIKDKMIEAGMMDEEWQLQSSSYSQAALIAKAIADQLNISDVWQVFGQLWGKKPEVLRTSFYRALDLRKSLVFQDKLKKILS